MTIGEKQIQLIDYVKFFFKNFKSSNIKSYLSGYCYFAAHHETPGYAKLNFRRNGWSSSVKFCIVIIKNILAIASHPHYIEFNNRNVAGKYNTMVISWAFKKNFQTDGSFKDRYFAENSKDLPDSHWILISMDGHVPTNLNSNITLIINKRGFFKYDFFSLIKIIIKTIFDCKFSLRKTFHYLSFPSYFANVISLTVKRELKKNNYKAILLPYEGKPFQHTAFFEAKKINTKIITIGYLHSLLTPLPSDFVYRPGAPDLLLVHGESLIEILQSKLDWSKDRLKLIQSLRFRQGDDKLLSKKIFLPIIISNKKKFIDEFRKLLISSPENSLPKFEVTNHQAMLNSKKHLDLKEELEEIMELYKNRFSEKSPSKNVSIFFGVTAAIFEALEKEIEVIHICSDPVFESHSEKIWPNLKVEQINNFTFRYKLIEIGKYINFGNKNKILYETLKPYFNEK